MASDRPTSKSEEVSDNPVCSSISEGLNKTSICLAPISPLCKEDCDDDVQFVSCNSLPKRRKGCKWSYLSLQDRLNSDGAVKETPAAEDSPPHQILNQGNTENPKSLKSCNVDHIERSISTEQGECLPKSPSPGKSVSEVRILSSSPLTNSLLEAAPKESLLPQVTPSATPWMDYLYADQPDPILKDWRPVCFSRLPAEKRKSQTETEKEVQASTPNQHVSPKTVHGPVSPAPQDPVSVSRTPIVPGSTIRGDAPQSTAPYGSTKNIWFDFEYEPINRLSPLQTNLQVAPRAIDPVEDTVTWPMASASPDNSNDNWPSIHQCWKSPQQAQIPKAFNNYAQNQGNYSNMFAAESTVISRPRQEHQSQTYSSSIPAVIPQTTSAPHMNTISEPVPYFCRTPQPPHLIQARTAWKGIPIASPQTQQSDLLRRPSLYSIPPWPSKTPTTPIHSRHKPQDSIESGITSGINGTSLIASGNASFPICASGPIQTKTPKNTHQSSQSNPQSAESSIRHPARTVAESNSDPTPRKRARHEHSPNLIVDMAETCEEVFPFAEVAARHDKPIQNVYDTFAAIIQIPLLQNSEDRRRHGSLAKRRMRGFRDAIKARDKAREVG